MSGATAKDSPPAGSSPVQDEYEPSASGSQHGGSTQVSTCSSPHPEAAEFKVSDRKVDDMKPEELKTEVSHLRQVLGKAISQIESLRAEMQAMKSSKDNWKRDANASVGSTGQSRGQSPPGPAHPEAAGSGESSRSVEDMEIDNNFQNRYWTQEEHQRFLQALKIFGHKDVRAIAEYVGTRNTTQIRTHAQKYFKKLEAKGQKLSDLGIPDRPAKSNPSPSSRRGSLKQSRDSSPFPGGAGGSGSRSRKNSVSSESVGPSSGGQDAVPSLPLGIPGFANMSLNSFPAGSPSASAGGSGSNANPLLINLLQQQQLQQQNLMQQHQLLQQHLQRQQVSGVDVLALAALQQMQSSS